MAEPTAPSAEEPSIGRASAFLASGTIVSRILGFVRAVLLTTTVGAIASKSGDAFGVANQLPNNIYAIVAGGVLSAILVPSIVKAFVHADRGRAYINKLLTIALVVLLAVTIVVTLAAPFIVHMYGTQLSPDQRALATAFAYWCLPQVLFYGLYSVLGEILNAHKMFGPFTWAPVLNNLVAMAGIIVFIVLFGSGSRPVTDWTPSMITLLAGSATLGIAAQALVLFLFWRRIGLRYRPDFRWRGVGLRQTGKLAGWTFAMLLVTQGAALIQTNIAGIASGEGASVLALQNAWLIFMLPHSVITVSVATAYFTTLSEHAHAGRIDELKADVSRAIRQISLLIVLAAGVIIVVALPFASMFTATHPQAGAMAWVIVAYIVGLLPFTVLFVLQRTFYALGDTRTPFFFTVLQSVVFVGLALACSLLPVNLVGLGLAFSISIAGGVQMLAAFFLLRRKLGGFDAVPVVKSIAVYSAAALPAMGLGWLVVWLLGATRADGFSMTSTVGTIVSMAAVGAVMALAYFGILVVLRTPELRGALAPVMRRLRRS